MSERSVADIKADIRETRIRLAANVDATTQRIPFLSSRDSDAGDVGPGRWLSADSPARNLLSTAVVGLAVFSAVRRRRLSRRTRARSGAPGLDIETLSAVLFDVDGTLIDSNGAHAETWAIALTEHGFRCRPEQVRPLVGMGADKLLPQLAGVTEDSEQRQAIGKRKKALFAERLPTLRPTPGARALVSFLREFKKDIVVATSSDEAEMRALLEQADVADLLPRRTSKDDAQQSKPDADIVCAALARAGSPAETTVMIGDTPYDTEAAHRAGISAIALRCGGYWADPKLRRAVAIFDNPADLLDHWRQDRR